MRFLILPILLPLLIAACADDGGEAERARVDEATARPTLPAEAVHPATPPDTSFHEELRRLEAETGGQLGVAAIELESGHWTAWRGEETFPMASVAKLPMMIAVLRDLERGRLRYDSVVTLTAADHRPGSSALFHHARRGDTLPTIHALIDATITESDNTACDYLLRLIGGPPRVDSLMKALGFTAIDVSHNEGDLVVAWAGVDPDSVRGLRRDELYTRMEQAGSIAWRSAESRLTNDPSDAATPIALMGLLRALDDRLLLKPAGTDTLLAMMGRCETGRARIPAQLGEHVRVAHKTGSISSVANDVGIVTMPDGRRVVMVILVKGATVGVARRNQTIASVAKLLSTL